MWRSTVPVEAELRIADQDFGAAEERDAAVNAGRNPVGSGALCGDVVGIAVLRVVERAVGPVVGTVGLQSPKNGQAAQLPLSQRGVRVAPVDIGLPVRCARSQQPDYPAACEPAAVEDLDGYSVRQQPRTIGYFGCSRATID